MKFLYLLLPVVSFTSAWGLMRWHFSHPQLTTPTQQTVVVGTTMEHPVPPDPHEALAKLLALPQDRAHDGQLAAFSESLLSTDPVAAFRAAMSTWHYDENGTLSAAAKALVSFDPSAARLMLTECPDLRTRNLLESVLIADEVRRNPQEKLAWADQNLHGYIRLRSLTLGVEALATTDPDAALAFVEEFPPGVGTFSMRNKALKEKLKQDPLAAAAWMINHLSKEEVQIVTTCATNDAYREDPEQILKFLPLIPKEIQVHMSLGYLMRDFGKLANAQQAFPDVLEKIHGLPPAVQDQMLRNLVYFIHDDSEGKSCSDLLAVISDPAERTAVVESLATQRLSMFGHKNEESLDWLNLLQTPADRQAAARVIPYVQSLTPAQRTDLLEKLK